MEASRWRPGSGSLCWITSARCLTRFSMPRRDGIGSDSRSAASNRRDAAIDLCLLQHDHAHALGRGRHRSGQATTFLDNLILPIAKNAVAMKNCRK
jgi:hypothetical protein